MGLASKVKNEQTKAEYTVSSILNTNYDELLETGESVCETAIYNGYPSPLAVSKGKRPFLIIHKMLKRDDEVGLDTFHAFMVKLCTVERFKSPEEFQNILISDGIQAQLKRQRQPHYGLRKVAILFV